MQKKKLNKPISFWYPIRTIAQYVFDEDGKTHTIPTDELQEGHILYQGRLICKQGMNRLMGECGAKRNKIVSERVKGVKLCDLCQEGYKKIPDLAWAHWINPPELKYTATVKINPKLIEENKNGNA